MADAGLTPLPPDVELEMAAVKLAGHEVKLGRWYSWLNLNWRDLLSMSSWDGWDLIAVEVDRTGNVKLLWWRCFDDSR